MIIKSFEIEKIQNQNNNIILLYGLNEGYKNQIINNCFIKNFKGELLRVEESEIITIQNQFIESILNKSLFEDNKIVIISRVTEKIINLIIDIKDRKIEGIKIILKSNVLEKNSKLRTLFEKEKDLTCVPFYEDNEKNLIIIIQNFVRETDIKLSREISNLLIERAKGDRNNLLKELKKIKYLSISKKNIQTEDVIELTNLAENYSVFELTDNYLAKNFKKVSRILNENNYNSEDCILILRTILNKSKRLLKLKNEMNNNNIDLVLSSFKPPIFWKEKEIVKKQIQSRSNEEVKKIIYKINDLELIIKKNSTNSLNFISDFVLNY